MFLLGPRGSGKTLVGRELAGKLGVFHIAFREYLQEQILSKMKRPPLVDEEDWEGETVEEGEEGQWYIPPRLYIYFSELLLQHKASLLLDT